MKFQNIKKWVLGIFFCGLGIFALWWLWGINIDLFRKPYPVLESEGTPRAGIYPRGGVRLPVGLTMLFRSPEGEYGCIRFDSIPDQRHATYSSWKCSKDGSEIKRLSNTKRTEELHCLIWLTRWPQKRYKGWDLGNREIVCGEYTFEWLPIAKIYIPDDFSVAMVRSKSENMVSFQAGDLEWRTTPFARQEFIQVEPVQQEDESDKEFNFRKGRYFLKKADFDKAAECFSKSAQADHCEAQYELGRLFSTGQGIRQDYDKAKKWFAAAAEQQHSDALTALGYIYKEGLGSTKQDFNKAAKYWQRAADVGNSEAQTYLGWMYHTGTGVEQSDEKAIRYYEKAVRRDSLFASNNLAYLYAERGIKLNRAEELVKSAIKEEPENDYYIGTYGWVLYKQGKYDKALKQLKRAVQLDSTGAEHHNHLAYVYAELNQDAKAKKHWQKALELTEDDELKEEVEAKLKQLP